MKLRFRNNSLRLRVNQREVDDLAAGSAIEERVHFPADACISYVLEPSTRVDADASFENGTIRVRTPQQMIFNWAHSDSVGIYFEIPANGARLQVAIEKDLECVDGPPEEHDPDAFPRSVGKVC
jgi:hypothetical protein